MTGRRTIKLGLVAVAALAVGAAGTARTPVPPASLWHGGTIITMDGPAPRTVQAVVVRAGKIVFAGSEARARQVAGPRPEDHDLHGATMLPGFIDAHSHFSMLMQVNTGIDLDAGDQPPADIPSLIGQIRSGIEKTRSPRATGWWPGTTRTPRWPKSATSRVTIWMRHFRGARWC